MAKTFINGFKMFFGFEEPDEDEEEGVIEEKELPIKEAPAQQPAYNSAATSFYTPSSKSRVVNIHANNSMKIEVYQPKAFEEAVEIVECLRGRKPVIVNLEAIQPELARKIFDFLSGALCAIDGKAEKISRGIFLMAPSNVEVNGKITSETAAEDSDFVGNTLFQFK